MYDSDATRRENVGCCSPLSCPAKAGHPGFQSARRNHYCRGVLDRPVKPGDDEWGLRWTALLALATARATVERLSRVLRGPRHPPAQQPTLP